MRRLLFLTAALALAPSAVLSAAPLSPQAAAERDVLVLNHARQPINELYASPASTESWGEDLLADQMLDIGHSVHLKLGHAKECLYDLEAVYADASREDVHGVDLCRLRSYVFDGSNAAPPPSTVALHQITLINHAARPVQQVFISSSDAGDWGDDRLTKSSISVSDSATLTYRGDCVADLRVVYDNRSAEERRGVDICTARRIAIQPGWVTEDSVPTEMQPGAEMLPLEVVNHTGHAVTSLFLYPAASADRGPDVLAGTPMPDGARLTVTVQRAPEVCGFAAHAVFGGKLPDQDFSGLDVCRNAAVELRGR